MMSWSRLRSAFCSDSVGNSSGHSEGLSTILAKITARQAAKGRRAQYRCSVEGCPCVSDVFFADSTLMAWRGILTSMSFFGNWACLRCFHCCVGEDLSTFSVFCSSGCACLNVPRLGALAAATNTCLSSCKSSIFSSTGIISSATSGPSCRESNSRVNALLTAIRAAFARSLQGFASRVLRLATVEDVPNH